MNSKSAGLLIVCLVFCVSSAGARQAGTGRTYRLYEGVTAYVNNPDGKAFTVRLDLRDTNLYANGPREVLLKIYDPDGRPVVREIIPDDGVTKPLFGGRIAGWDHELQYFANLYAKGARPAIRFSALSDPARLAGIVARKFEHKLPAGRKGIYRVVLAGTRDQFATLALSPDLEYGIVGHPTWMHGHGDMLKKSYVYIPKGTVGIFFAVAEPDQPITRTFRLTAPDGKVLFSGRAVGGYVSAGGKAWQHASINFKNPKAYEGKLLTLDVSEGAGDFLVKCTLQQPRKGPFGDYVGMGSLPVWCATPKLAMALKGGTIIEDGELFWHPFQVRFHRWLKAHPPAANAGEAQKQTRARIEKVFNYFRLIETSDARGSASWTNLAYAFGYSGCTLLWRDCWLLMKDRAVPADLKEIIREGLIMGGDRLSFATGIERINGNAFAQIPVGLWYIHRASGDALQKERFEVFWDRWANEGWGAGAGLSRSGDAQEHLAHDMHYGSYILENWRGGTWLHAGILADATDDPRFRKVIDRYCELYSYLYCREVSGRAVSANPWSCRTQQSAHDQQENWEVGSHKWKGEPGADFTTSVNGGDEWFAARRKGYYALTFFGRISPEWMSATFPGQLGFSGGILCQLTVPGKGPVLASILNGPYGEGMHPSNWRNFQINSVVGERWDGAPFVAAISEHPNARLNGNTVTGSGEIRASHMRSARSYTFNADSIDCSVKLSESSYANVLSLWSHERNWSEVKVAYEMIPFMGKTPGGKATAVTLLGAGGKAIGAAAANAVEAARIRIDRGGFGVVIELDKPRPVRRGANNTVMILLAKAGAKPVPADRVAIRYRLVPFGR